MTLQKLTAILLIGWMTVLPLGITVTTMAWASAGAIQSERAKRMRQQTGQKRQPPARMSVAALPSSYAYAPRVSSQGRTSPNQADSSLNDRSAPAMNTAHDSYAYSNPTVTKNRKGPTSVGESGNQEEEAADYAPVHSQVATKLKVSEYQFLITLGRSLSKSNAAMTNRIYQVVEQLKQSPRLTADNYTFLNKLSKCVSNPQVAQEITWIAEEHHPVY